MTRMFPNSPMVHDPLVLLAIVSKNGLSIFVVLHI